MAIDPIKLSDWLRAAMLSPRLARISQIELLHMYPSGEGKTAKVWDWGQDEPLPKLEDQINAVIEESTSYANGVADGTIRFMLLAYHGKDHAAWGTKFPFYIVARSPEQETAAYGASEPASPSGLLSQLMRHLERREEMLTKTIDSTNRLTSKVMGDMQIKLTDFENKNFDTIKLYEDLLDRKHERELSALYRAREDDRKSKAWQLLFSLGPVIASQILSPKLAAVLPSQVVDGGPAMALIRQLAQSIGDEQMPQLATALKPEQLMMLMELHRIVGDETGRKNDAEEAAMHEVPASAADMRREREAMERMAAEQAAAEQWAQEQARQNAEREAAEARDAEEARMREAAEASAREATEAAEAASRVEAMRVEMSGTRGVSGAPGVSGAHCSEPLTSDVEAVIASPIIVEPVEVPAKAAAKKSTAKKPAAKKPAAAEASEKAPKKRGAKK